MTFEQLSGPPEPGPAVRPVLAAPRVRSELVEAVYVHHYPDVYRYALALTRSHDNAQEIASDVFARALERWTTVPEPPLPWLLVVTRRLATDRWRRARRLARILWSGQLQRTVDGGQERAEFWTWFQAISALLTARQREALVLRYRRDLTDDQIAEVMGLSASGVRSLVARALDVLRSHPEVL
jgi:RNA polymerase sigma factor, sigma-70 family